MVIIRKLASNNRFIGLLNHQAVKKGLNKGAPKGSLKTFLLGRGITYRFHRQTDLGEEPGADFGVSASQSVRSSRELDVFEPRVWAQKILGTVKSAGEGEAAAAGDPKADQAVKLFRQPHIVARELVGRLDHKRLGLYLGRENFLDDSTAASTVAEDKERTPRLDSQFNAGTGFG